jgi:hypothetical protein
VLMIDFVLCASVMSSRSRRSGRSVDSLADVALAAMKNSKGFVATMKDKIGTLLEALAV